MEDVKLLKKLPLFKEFKTTELMNVAMVARHELYRAGEVIFREASEGDALYVIKSGRARVTKCDSSDREFVLAYLSESEYFGEIALVDSSPRSASVYADADTEVLKIRRGDFKNLIQVNKEMERKFYKSFTEVLCQRLRATNENLTFSQEINRMIKEAEKDKG